MTLKFPSALSHTVLIAALAFPVPLFAQSAPPLQVRDVLAIREFADRVQLDLSPDGKFVAYAMQEPARATLIQAGARYFTGSGVPVTQGGTNVYVTEVLAAQTKNISENRGSSWAPAWSPDGRTLAFLSDRDGAVRVWLWTRATKKLRRLSADPVRVNFGFEGLRWSPNGRRIALKLSPAGMSRAQLDRLLPSSRTRATRRLPGDAVTAVVFAGAAERDSADAPEAAANLDSTRSFLNASLADLAIIDVATGRAKRVAPRVRVMGWQWSPDASRLAFSTRQPDDGSGALAYDRYDLFVTDTTGKQPPRLVAARMVQEYGLAFSWSPSGRQLAFASGKALNVVARDGSDARRLAAGERPFALEYRAPLWVNEQTLLAASGDSLWKVSVASGEATLVATPSERRLLGIVARADAQRLSRNRVIIATHDPVANLSGFRGVDVATGNVSGRIEQGIALGVDGPYRMDVSSDGKTIAYVAERGDRPSEVWITQDDLTHTNRITNLNPQVTRLPLGASRLIQWTALVTGDVVRGALLMPGNYEPGKRFPVVVKLTGGSRPDARLNHFGLEWGIDNLQLLATRGYGVLLADAPLRVGTPMADLAAGLLPALDSLIAMGLADSTRLAIIGQGYGGYAALSMLVQTHRFRAAISVGGFSNLFSQYGEMRADGSATGVAWAERERNGGRMGGSPWEFRDRYLENSPYFYFDRVTAPVLLLHGGADQTVPSARSEETFVALRRLGKDVVLVRYEGEDHLPGTWSVANATDYWERIFDWLNKHIPAK